MKLVSFDLEYNPASNKVDQFGYWANDGSSSRSKNLHQIITVLDEAEILMGHNVLYHDLEVMDKQFGFQPKTDQIIDTLLLSSLLFIEKPYHKLTKNYLSRLNLDEVYNPELDSRIVLEQLLPELQGKWDKLPGHQRSLNFHLLQKELGFNGFFKLLQFETNTSLEDDLNSLDKSLFCTSTNLISIAMDWPVELAYALALINSFEKQSTIPVWLAYTFPQIQIILGQLRSTKCNNVKCKYCQENLSATAGLKNFFGFEGFRKFSENEQVPLQQQIVEEAIEGNSLLAILPTGGGKSLCYQIPALMAHKQKQSLTLVISPLQSLMKDQVDNLWQKDITSAYTINGLIDPISRAKAVEAIEDGRASLLYINPESLRSPSIFHIIQKRNIERVVIDEAHCFSNWGHDFRPDYLYIAQFIQNLQNAQPWKNKIPISCFTATAKPEVIKDISDYFLERLDIVLEKLITSAPRTNLSYKVTATTEEDKFDRLLGILDEVKGPTIIYASRTRRCQEIVDDLKKYRKEAVIYHGQLKPDFKKSQQDLFMNGEVDIMVATSAFGMGVDKDNVTNVIHYEISNSLENYVQEAGRAGRNKDINAECHILFSESDLQKHFSLLNSTKLNKKEVDQIWRALKYFKRRRFSKSALEIAEKAGWDTEMRDLEVRVKTAISTLEESGFITREENATRVFAKSVLAKNFESARKVIEENSGLRGKELDTPIRIMQYLFSRQETQVDSIALHLGLSKEEVGTWINKFKEWSLLGDSIELEAYLSLVKSKNSSKRLFKHYSKIEESLIKYFREEKNDRVRVHLKQLHEDIFKDEQSATSFLSIQRILGFWELNRKIEKHSIGTERNWIEIDFRGKKNKSLEGIAKRIQLAEKALAALHSLVPKDEAANKSKQVKVIFTTNQLRQYLLKSSKIDYSLNQIEEALYYLIKIEAIALEGGLLVFYKPMKISRKSDTKRQYNKQDFELLENFYQHKTEQIHIVGKYAQKMLRSHLEALQFVDDYFNLDYDDFINKYFKGEKGKIKRPITDQKFRELFVDKLDPEQLKIVKDIKNDRILIGAGPGSGKTRILVHKVASTVLMEDVKPEQFLLLTFSRPAVEEMKNRLRDLIGSTIYGMDIKTFHSYAFDLLGKKGDLERSINVINEATEQLRDESQYFPNVARKEVILIDEYQDVDEDQFQLLKEIVRLAGNVRVIVVGDDDQNIYEFRGSSIKYMKEFASGRNRKDYYLTKNYRSKKNLVEFANSFLSTFPDTRLKEDQELVPYDQRNGKIEIHRYPDHSKPFHFLIDSLIQNTNSETKAILTRTNEEALLIHSLLIEKGIRPNLVMGGAGYRVKDIIEVEAFTYWIHDIKEHGTGRIGEDKWDETIFKLKQHFAKSTILREVLGIITGFSQNRQHLFWTDWVEYISEIRPEDLAKVEAESIWVSTMHKAKGKEFDSVYLFLDNYPLKSPSDYRLLYVAMTRAINGLYVFTNTDILNLHLSKYDNCIVHRETPVIANEITLLMGLKDINLGSIKTESDQKALKTVFSGQGLDFEVDESKILIGYFKLRPSKKFQNDSLHKWMDKGYSIREAYVDRVVLWYDKDSEKGYRVPLPRLILSNTREN